jgi:D-amino-acid dehydrogenase
MRLAEKEMMALVDRAGMAGRVRHDGSLELYESEAQLRASEAGWQRRATGRHRLRACPRPRLEELQPGLSPRFVAGTFVPGWKTVSEPQAFALALWAHARTLRRHLREGRGAWSESEAAPSLAAACRWFDQAKPTGSSFAPAPGRRVCSRQSPAAHSARTERGYNTTLPKGAFDVKRQLIFGNHGFVITPLETGVRVGGAVELAGLDLPPNYARSKAMLDKAADFLPGLKTTGGTEWMGFRPSLP